MLKQKKNKPTRRNGKQHSYTVMFAFFPQLPSHPRFFCSLLMHFQFPFSLPAASVPTEAPQTALEAPTLLPLLSNSRELNEAPGMAWNQIRAVQVDNSTAFTPIPLLLVSQ